MTTSPKWGIPLVASQQAQPEVTHNAAVLLFQARIGGVITQQNAPPGSPADGDAYLVGTAGTGAWAGKNNKLAFYFGGWMFLPGVTSAGVNIPIGTDHEGLEVYNQTTNIKLRWSGTAWASAGTDIGTPPDIVQVAISKTGTQSITLGSTPVSGNLLVAFFFNPVTGTVGAGWTSAASNTSGTDFGVIATKVAGGAESTTQSPITSSPGGTGLIVMYELHHAAGTPFLLTSALQAMQASLVGASGVLASIKDCIALGVVDLVSTSNDIGVMYNMTEDARAATGTGRQGVAGHSFADTPIAQILAKFTSTGTPGNKCFVALFGHP